MVGGGGLGGDSADSVGASRVVDTKKESRIIVRLFLCGLLIWVGVVGCSGGHRDGCLRGC